MPGASPAESTREMVDAPEQRAWVSYEHSKLIFDSLHSS